MTTHWPLDYRSVYRQLDRLTFYVLRQSTLFPDLINKVVILIVRYPLPFPFIHTIGLADTLLPPNHVPHLLSFDCKPRSAEEQNGAFENELDTGGKNASALRDRDCRFKVGKVILQLAVLGCSQQLGTQIPSFRSGPVLDGALDRVGLMSQEST